MNVPQNVKNIKVKFMTPAASALIMITEITNAILVTRALKQYFMRWTGSGTLISLTMGEVKPYMSIYLFIYLFIILLFII